MAGIFDTGIFDKGIFDTQPAASGSLAATESGADDFDAAGTIVVAGSLAAQEAAGDAFSGAGAVVVSGALDAVETGSDGAAISGSVPASGSLAAAEAGADAFTGDGVVPVSGVLDANETGGDGASIAGDVLVTGALAATEAGADIFSGFGAPPVPTPEQDNSGGTGAGQPVGSSHRPNPFREAIREANRPREPEKRSAKPPKRKPVEPVTGLLAQIADSITPEAIAAEIERQELLGAYIDELTARAELARQIMQDDEDAMIVLMLAV